MADKWGVPECTRRESIYQPPRSSYLFVQTRESRWRGVSGWAAPAGGADIALYVCEPIVLMRPAHLQRQTSV